MGSELAEGRSKMKSIRVRSLSLRGVGRGTLGILFVLLASCMHQVTVHPGALNAADSRIYDGLTVAQAAIDQARIELNAGRLPEASRQPLNALIAAYNAARTAWL